MLSDETVSSWIAAFAVFVVLSIVALQTPREVKEYSLFRQSTDTGERIAFFRKWLFESFSLYTLVSLTILFLIGRLDELSSLPPEFVALQRSIFDSNLPEEAAFRDLSFSYAMGIIVGVCLAIFIGLMLRKAVAIVGSKLKINAPDIEPLIPRNGKERFPVMALTVNASVGEEFFFRLLLPLTLVLIGVPTLWAFVLAIIVFGLVHLYQGWTGVALTAFAGLALTYVYLRAGSIWTPVAVHFLINAVALFIRPSLSQLLGDKSKGTN